MIGVGVAVGIGFIKSLVQRLVNPILTEDENFYLLTEDGNFFIKLE